MIKLDTIYENANFITQDTERPRAHRIGVLNGRILAIDESLIGVDSRHVVDLQGATVLPGFNDVHTHVSWFGRTLSEIDLSDLRIMSDVYARIAERRPKKRHDWILCTGFDHHRFAGAYPDIETLDSITGDQPLYIRHTSGHASIVNSAALHLIGADLNNFHDPEGGRVVRDAVGKPTGLLQEQAQGLVQSLFKPYSQVVLKQAIKRATERLAADGITSVCDAGVGVGWVGDSPVELAAYQSVKDEGNLATRVQVMPLMDTLHSLPASLLDDYGIGLDLGIRSNFGDDYLSLGPVKIFADGSLSGETAAVSEAYIGDPHNVGFLQHDESFLHEQIVNTLKSGWGVATHAIGDRGIDVALNAYEDALNRKIIPPLPLRIEHAGIMRPDQLRRIAALGIVPTTQSVFFENIGDGILDSLSPERVAWTYRGKSLLDAGILLPGSSDVPCADSSALLGIEKFVTRTTSTGREIGPRVECLSVEEAIYAYTVGSAKATGMGEKKGKLREGYLADFVALNRSPFEVAPTEISSIDVMMTVVGDTVTYVQP